MLLARLGFPAGSSPAPAAVPTAVPDVNLDLADDDVLDKTVENVMATDPRPRVRGEA
jgi:hypothetical protein